MENENNNGIETALEEELREVGRAIKVSIGERDRMRFDAIANDDE